MQRNRQSLATALCLAAFFFALASQAFASGPNNADNQDPPGRVARLTQIQGDVSIQPAGVQNWTQASENYPMTTGDRMYVDANGRAELQLGQAVVHIWHYTDLSVTNLNNDITQLGLSQGSLHVRTFTLDPNHTVEVDTPNGAITVMQPGDFRIDCYTGDGGTVVTVNSGEIEISGPKLSQTLGTGHSVRLMGTNPITVTSLSLAGKDPFDAWSQQRDRTLLSSQTRQYVNPDTIGSDDLDQYGTWNDTPGYGSVWYPNSVPVGWVPYSTGSWVWVSPWGWTWVDAYPWGFAPFHYGRWAYYGNRWGWVPGPFGVVPIYSPALVGFVGGPGFAAGIGIGGGIGLSAWFPLGPGEPYYPWYHCSPGYFSQVNVTNINRVTINRVTNITNITNNNYYRYYHKKGTFRNIRYANRNIATTAVRANEFASGRLITPRTAIHPTRQQMAHTEIIPHPFITPTTRSVVPHPVTAVPVSSQRPNLITFRGEQRLTPGARNSAVPSRPTVQQPSRVFPQLGNMRPAPNTASSTYRNNTEPYTEPGRTARNGARLPSTIYGGSQPGKTLLTRTPPPPARPTFEQREPALRQDPGRPLDPGQLDNLSRGRPVGPARPPDFPPHPAWAPRPMFFAPRGGGMPRR